MEEKSEDFVSAIREGILNNAAEHGLWKPDKLRPLAHPAIY